MRSTERTFEQRLRSFEEDVAAILSERMHSRERRTKPPVIAARLSLQSEREVNRQAAGEAHAQFRVWFALAEDDPEGGHLVLNRAAQEIGQELHPASRELAKAPTLQEALSSVTQAARCSSESTAIAYAKLHDGRLEDQELAELEWQWTQEDRQRQAMRDALRAMAEPTEAGTKVERMRGKG